MVALRVEILGVKLCADRQNVICVFVKFLLYHAKISRYFLDQSEEKPKPIGTRLHAFSRASHRLLTFDSMSELFASSALLRVNTLV